MKSSLYLTISIFLCAVLVSRKDVVFVRQRQNKEKFSPNNNWAIFRLGLSDWIFYKRPDETNQSDINHIACRSTDLCYVFPLRNLLKENVFSQMLDDVY